MQKNTDFEQDLTTWLVAWRLWLLAAILGAGLAAAVYFIFPPAYRARASVTVDHNLEQALPQGADRDLFYYLERETEKLTTVAWADATLEAVAAQVPGMSVQTLRGETLSLSQPKDGAWHFWADSANPQQAQSLAAIWAQAFVSQVRSGMDAATQLSAAQKSLEAAVTDAEKAVLTARIADLQTRSLGISPYLQVSLSQDADLPVKRAVSLGAYLLAGSALAVLLAFLYLINFSPARPART
jgi:capsular polysaccharide biosynthesis protein